MSNKPELYHIELSNSGKFKYVKDLIQFLDNVWRILVAVKGTPANLGAWHECMKLLHCQMDKLSKWIGSPVDYMDRQGANHPPNFKNLAMTDSIYDDINDEA